MRVYLSVDMEGLAGVSHPAQTYFGRDGIDRTDYDRSRGLMAGETNAAIQGAVTAGATEVVVNDSHWQMRNLRAEDLDAEALLIIGDKPYSMTEGIGRFDAAAFIGYHAGAGHPAGVIGHTYSSVAIMEVRVDGIAHNEAGLNALRLAEHSVPVVLVAGDDALAGEVEQLLPWAERVVVKRALGGHVAESLSPERAQSAIRDGMGRALGRLGEMQLYRRPARIRCEVDLREPVMADYASVLPVIERVGPRTVAFEADDGESLFRWFVCVFRLAGVPAA
ncbi:MAG: M55 family metallopeptidase [Chloroflexota bacterium]|nr:M55 family metallopeptidase [Chloroflexota bacterium]